MLQSNLCITSTFAYLTPPAWAEALALPLPAYRPVMVDLTCGNHNICDGREGMLTDILYFARSHTSGCNKELTANSLAEAAQALAVVGKSRLGLRAGSVVRQYEGGHTAATAELWDAIGLEWRTDQGKNRPTDQRWNIWLDADGTLATNLTPFQEAAEPLKKEQYVRLHALKGKHPMQLILQKAERKDLERAVFGTIWRVAPAVIEAVQGALAEYNAVRSPLYPLSQIQRLGYGPGSKEEAICFAEVLRAAWEKHPAALKWLELQKVK